MSSNNVSQNTKTRQGKEYAKGMSRLFGRDVSGSEPVQNYDKAAMKRRIGRPKNSTKS